MDFDRREFTKLAGMAGVVFASGLVPAAGRLGRAAAAAATRSGAAPAEDFYFVQLSDSHWGFSGPPNPEAATTLKRAVAAVNSMSQQPDFIVFTGDLTHTTDDEQERRRRMAQFRDIVSELKVKDVRFLPGEHDASLDRGGAYREFFGEPTYSFDHKGVHFIALDNVSDPGGAVGEPQIGWLRTDLAKLDRKTPIVVLTHRPLFDLYPQWDWATRDGAAVVDALMPYENVTVFYGHIHQENHHTTGHIAHHAATSLIFPLPAPGSQPKRAPLAWDPAHPFKGLGWRLVEAETYGGSQPTAFEATERPLAP